MIQPEILFTNILQHFFFLIQCCDIDLEYERCIVTEGSIVIYQSFLITRSPYLTCCSGFRHCTVGFFGQIVDPVITCTVTTVVVIGRKWYKVRCKGISIIGCNYFWCIYKVKSGLQFILVASSVLQCNSFGWINNRISLWICQLPLCFFGTFCPSSSCSIQVISTYGRKIQSGECIRYGIVAGYINWCNLVQIDLNSNVVI